MPDEMATKWRSDRDRYSRVEERVWRPAAPARPAGPTALTCALLEDAPAGRPSPVLPLVETRLLAREGLALVERQAIAAIGVSP